MVFIWNQRWRSKMEKRAKLKDIARRGFNSTGQREKKT
jgi:hypothetical protein